jgi:hypothetical protein
MFQIKVTNNDNSEKVLKFPESIRNGVTHKYNQLISQGDIKDYQFI